MPWPWERRQQVTERLDEAVNQLDQRIADLRREVERLRALRQAQQRGEGPPCPSS
jgi:uncharacterized small protein (DUF1192 family)